MRDPGLFIADGVKFRGDDWAGEGFTIKANGVTGWLDSPGYRIESVAREVEHGTYDVPAYAEAREITISGRCRYGSPFEGGKFVDQLRAIGARGLFRLQGEYMGQLLHCDARKLDHKFRELHQGRRGEYQLTMRAADPRLYGDVEVFTGTSFTMVHRGTDFAIPEVTVTGSMPNGYRLVGPGGREVVVTRPLVSSAPHVVSFRTRRLTINGVTVPRSISKAKVWSVPPGRDGASMQLVPVSGSGQLRVPLPATFI